jgi:hypothetical protein
LQPLAFIHAGVRTASKTKELNRLVFFNAGAFAARRFLLLTYPHAFDPQLSSRRCCALLIWRHQSPSTKIKSLNEVFTMAFIKAPPHDYRIENVDAASGSLLPPSSSKHLYADYSLAVAVAVKSVADPTRQEVRVVHVPSGEVVFRTSGSSGTSGASQAF